MGRRAGLSTKSFWTWQDDMSVHSPCKALPSSASSLSKEQSHVELELTLLVVLEICPPVKLRGKFSSLTKKSYLFLVLSVQMAFDQKA
ncbi:hypothetical protein YC2023_033039 [Brassica napus]